MNKMERKIMPEWLVLDIIYGIGVIIYILAQIFIAGNVSGLKECYAVPTGLYPKNESGKYEVDDSIADKTIVCDNLGDAIDKILRNEFSVNDD